MNPLDNDPDLQPLAQIMADIDAESDGDDELDAPAIQQYVSPMAALAIAMDRAQGMGFKIPKKFNEKGARPLLMWMDGFTAGARWAERTRSQPEA